MNRGNWIYIAWTVVATVLGSGSGWFFVLALRCCAEGDMRGLRFSTVISIGLAAYAFGLIWWARKYLKKS